MSRLALLLLRTLIPVFLVAILFFVLILQLVDLFANIVRYLEQGVDAAAILNVQLLYLPRSLSFALPMAVLFSVSFTVGTLYSNNELISVFGAGISLARFVLPALLFGLMLSGFSFWFEEYVVIDSMKERDLVMRELLNRGQGFSNSNITRLTEGSGLLYNVDFYNDANQDLVDLFIVERDADGQIERIVDAERAEWNGAAWVLLNATIYEWTEDRSLFAVAREDRYSQEHYTLSPVAFRRRAENIDEMRIGEAEAYIASLIESRQPYREVLTNYYERYSFALTPFIVALLSSALGGRFRKNILLMSLLLSLSLSVIYFVSQMVAVILASLGYIPPLAGAWGGFALFFLAGLVNFRLARS